MKIKRKIHRAAIKSKATLTATKSDKTMSELSTEFSVHPSRTIGKTLN